MRLLRLFVLGLLVVGSLPATARGASLSFAVTDGVPYEYGRQTVIPSGFGAGEFTLELWIKPDPSFPIGPTGSGQGQIVNWSSADLAPYSAADWWYDGNFLLDGHNNSSFSAGTVSLQFYGGGRLRALIGDGADPGPGRVWSAGAYPATLTPSLLDGAWHRVALVRRFAGAAASRYELWIDGVLVDAEQSPVRVDMRGWFDGWPGFPSGQAGWFWGAEKQAAIGVLTQYEDYKGLFDELRFWNRARTPEEIAAGDAQAPTGAETGLAASYRFDEGSGASTCPVPASGPCMSLVNWSAGRWSADGAPLGGSPPGQPPPGPGAKPPVLTSVTLTRTRIRPGSVTTLRFDVSTAAALTVVVDRLVAGRRRGTRCVPGARVGPVCTRLVRRVTLSRTVAAGAGTVRLPARPGGRSLAPGRYRVTVLARNAAGLAKPRRVILAVVRP